MWMKETNDFLVFLQVWLQKYMLSISIDGFYDSEAKNCIKGKVWYIKQFKQTNHYLPVWVIALLYLFIEPLYRRYFYDTDTKGYDFFIFLIREDMSIVNDWKCNFYNFKQEI